MSQGVVKSTDNNYLVRSKRGSFELSEVALNVTPSLTDDLSAGIQLFARDLGPIGNYDAKFDWFYLDWRPRDWFSLRAGRVRLPFGLYNDSSDYDPGRVFVLLPQSVYPTTSRELLLALTGVEAYGSQVIGPAGLIDYRLYGGTLFIDISEASTPATAGVPYVAGGRLMWETPLSGLRLGGSMMTVRLDARATIGPAEVAIKIPAVLWVASAEWIVAGLRLAAEYSRWHLEVESTNPALAPESESESERYYVSSAFEVTPWLQAGAYYSAYFPDVTERDGADAYQHDIAATLRFDVSEHWLVKLEGHLMEGTAVLSSSLNRGPRADLAETWGAFFLKTTAYF